MLIELHVLQNFAPSNLNRDDTGAPKSCQFGGVTRARVSSQCWKRAARKSKFFAKALENNGGVRTKRLILEVAERLTAERPIPSNIENMVAEVFEEAGLKQSKVKRGVDAGRSYSNIILYLSRTALDEMAGKFRGHLPTLLDGKKQGRKAVIQELTDVLVKSAKSPDIALFGRMIEIDAGKPFGGINTNVEAACQMAHSISTHQVNAAEFDYFTAMGELGDEESSGAAMIGTTEFNSACHYSYTNINTGELISNLGGEVELAKQAARSFLESLVRTVPTGKKTSFSTPTRPSLVLALVREGEPCSLANAFENPVRTMATGGIIKQSVERLDRHFKEINDLFGEFNSNSTISVCTTHNDCLTNLKSHDVGNFDVEGADCLSKLINRTIAAAFDGEGKPQGEDS